MQSIIESKLNDVGKIHYLQVVNESHMHGGPATESHFKVTLVSANFSKLSLVKRHQLIYGILSEELSGGVHALALHLYTPGEWSEHETISPNSPDCKGGSS